MNYEIDWVDRYHGERGTTKLKANGTKGLLHELEILAFEHNCGTIDFFIKNVRSEEGQYPQLFGSLDSILKRGFHDSIKDARVPQKNLQFNNPTSASTIVSKILSTIDGMKDAARKADGCCEVVCSLWTKLSGNQYYVTELNCGIWTYNGSKVYCNRKSDMIVENSRIIKTISGKTSSIETTVKTFDEAISTIKSISGRIESMVSKCIDDAKHPVHDSMIKDYSSLENVHKFMSKLRANNIEYTQLKSDLIRTSSSNISTVRKLAKECNVKIHVDASGSGVFAIDSDTVHDALVQASNELINKVKQLLDKAGFVAEFKGFTGSGRAEFYIVSKEHSFTANDRDALNVLGSELDDVADYCEKMKSPATFNIAYNSSKHAITGYFHVDKTYIKDSVKDSYEIEELAPGETIDTYKNELAKYNLRIQQLSGREVKIIGNKNDIIRYFAKMGIDEDMLDIHDSDEAEHKINVKNMRLKTQYEIIDYLESHNLNYSVTEKDITVKTDINSWRMFIQQCGSQHGVSLEDSKPSLSKIHGLIKVIDSIKDGPTPYHIPSDSGLDRFVFSKFYSVSSDEDFKNAIAEVKAKDPTNYKLRILRAARQSIGTFRKVLKFLDLSKTDKMNYLKYAYYGDDKRNDVVLATSRSDINSMKKEAAAMGINLTEVDGTTEFRSGSKAGPSYAIDYTAFKMS